VLALSDVSATIGLILVFMVIFPALVQGILLFIAAQVMGERRQNQEYRPGRRAASE
jgi:phage shock protein PspC (stress-responsive transcriptional regulator)